MPLVTIDPADAKDHDDAVHAEPDTDPKNPGGFIVCRRHRRCRALCAPGSALDREALVRGNSVYFPDRVVPMLPERISNDLCSLRPNEDRAALGVRMVDRRRRPQAPHTFHRVLIRSAAKLSYQQAQGAIDGWPDDDDAVPCSPPRSSRSMPPIARVKRARDERAAARSRPAGAQDRAHRPQHRRPRDDAGAARRPPADRGVHDPRQCRGGRDARARARAADLSRARRARHGERQCAARIPQDARHPLAKGRALRAEQFNHILARVKGPEAEKLVNEVVLRTQAQAEYAAENYGHFGLNLRRYAHFTSPIRRYADLVVHRALIRALKLGDGGLPETAGPARRSARSRRASRPPSAAP